MMHEDLNSILFKNRKNKKIAETIQSALNCEIERIQDIKNREGILGWLLAGRDAGKKATTKLKNIQKKPSNYDIVIIGTPTWNGHVSVPIRTYLQEHMENFPNVALFSTGDIDKTGALDDMREILKKRILTSMHLIRENEIDNNQYHKKVEAFVNKINSFTL